MDVFVMAEEPHRSETLAAALRASGFDAGAAGAGPSDPGAAAPGTPEGGNAAVPDAELVVLVGATPAAVSDTVGDTTVPVVAIPESWPAERQARLARAAAASVLGRTDEDLPEDAVAVGDLVIESDAHVATRSGVPIDLTHREFLLLALLARHPNRVLNRDSLMEQLWGSEAVTPNTIEVHISSLRRKLEAYGPRLIFTVRRVGYVLRPNGSSRSVRPAAASATARASVTAEAPSRDEADIDLDQVGSTRTTERDPDRADAANGTRTDREVSSRV